MNWIMNFLRRLLGRLRGGGGAYYINGPETLPAPLTPQEEAETFEGLSRGEEESKERLIVHNLRLVVYISKKFDRIDRGSDLHRDDRADQGGQYL